MEDLAGLQAYKRSIMKAALINHFVKDPLIQAILITS